MPHILSTKGDPKPLWHRLECANSCGPCPRVAGALNSRRLAAWVEGLGLKGLGSRV